MSQSQTPLGINNPRSISTDFGFKSGQTVPPDWVKDLQSQLHQEIEDEYQNDNINVRISFIIDVRYLNILLLEFHL